MQNGPFGSDLDRLSFGQRVLQFNAEIPYGAVHLGMTQQELNRSQVARLTVDERDFGPAHRVRAVRCWVQPDGFHPFAHEASVLTRRDVQPFVEPAGPEEYGTDHERLLHPAQDRFTRTFGDLETNWPLGLALND